MSLTRAQILAAEDLDHEDVEVPEWGGSVRLVSPSGLAREELVVAWTDESEPNQIRRATQLYPVLLVSMAHEINEDGTTGPALFSMDDVPSLRQKNGAVVERVALSAMKLAGFTADAVDSGEGD